MCFQSRCLDVPVTSLVQPLKQITPGTFKRPSNSNQHLDRWSACARFNFLNKTAVNLGEFRQLFLGKVRREPQFLHVLSKSSRYAHVNKLAGIGFFLEPPIWGF
jgi:hypothetical protein